MQKFWNSGVWILFPLFDTGYEGIELSPWIELLQYISSDMFFNEGQEFIPGAIGTPFRQIAWLVQELHMFSHRVKQLINSGIDIFGETIATSCTFNPSASELRSCTNPNTSGSNLSCFSFENPERILWWARLYDVYIAIWHTLISEIGSSYALSIDWSGNYSQHWLWCFDT